MSGILDLAKLGKELVLTGIQANIILFGVSLSELLLEEDVGVSKVEDLLVEKVEVLLSLLVDEIHDVLGHLIKFALNFLFLLLDSFGKGFEVLLLSAEDVKVFGRGLDIFLRSLSVFLVESSSLLDQLLQWLESFLVSRVINVEKAFNAVKFLLRTKFSVDSLDWFRGMDRAGNGGKA